jgi:predicted unusual protein kinase regulating ubiquinone biosynthesis (AarF/ABC1/UbiB family)
VLEAALPEEQAGPYRAALTKLQDAAPPMPAATVRAVMAAELGAGWRSLFTAFEEKPAAAASVGQVHRATWSDGRQVAVKVQYPGAGDALLGDLDQVGRLVRVAAGWIPGMEVGPIIAELRERVAEELDYRAEGAAQQAFADAFADDDEVVVPAVVMATGRVLVSEWLDGVPLSKVIAEGTQEQRDLAARRYLEVLLLGPARAGLLHADPHPGNFRLTPDGRFGILDFGAVNRLPDGMPPAIGRLLGAALDGDSETVADGLREEGFIRERIQVDPDQLLDYLSPFLEPLRHEEFRFDRAWLQSLFKHVNDRERPEWTINLKVNLPPEYVLIHRVWFGGIGVMCQLGGVVPAVQVLADFLPEFAEGEFEDSEVS